MEQRKEKLNISKGESSGLSHPLKSINVLPLILIYSTVKFCISHSCSFNLTLSCLIQSFYMDHAWKKISLAKWSPAIDVFCNSSMLNFHYQNPGVEKLVWLLEKIGMHLCLNDAYGCGIGSFVSLSYYQFYPYLLYFNHHLVFNRHARFSNII